MKDKAGLEVCVGDRVVIDNNEHAIVVFVAGSEDEDPDYLKNDWDEISDGVLVRTEAGASVQYHGCHSESITKL